MADSDFKFSLTVNAKQAIAKIKDLGERLKGVGDGEKPLSKLIKGFTEAERGANSLYSSLSMFTGAVAGIAAVATAINALKTGIETAGQRDRELLRLRQLVEQTGYAAGFTAEELQEMARTEALNTLGDTEGITKAISILGTFKAVAGDTFKRSIALASDMQETLGTEMAGGATMLGKALENPIAGLSALAEVGVSFTESQQQQIRAMMAANDLIGAQSMILDVLEGQLGGTAKAAALGYAGAVDTMGQRWDEFWEALGRESDSPIIGVLTVLSEQLREATEYLNAGKDAGERYSNALQKAEIEAKKLAEANISADNIGSLNEDQLNLLRNGLIKQLSLMEGAKADMQAMLDAGADVDGEQLQTVAVNAMALRKELNAVNKAFSATGFTKYSAEVNAALLAVARARDDLTKKQAALQESEAKAAEKSALEEQQAKVSAAQKILAERERTLQDSLKKEQEYSAKIKELTNQITDVQESAADRVLAIQQRDMSEAQRQASIEQQIADKIAQAQAAQAAGDQERAQQLATQAQSLGERLNNEEKAIAAIQAGAQIITDSKKAEIAAYEDASAAERTAQAELRDEIETTQASLQTLRDELEALRNPEPIKLAADVDQAEAALQSARDALAALKDKTVTVTVNTVQAKRSGGQVMRIPSIQIPAFNRGGKFPGHSGPDRFPVMAGPGEWFITAKQGRSHIADSLLRTIQYGPISDVKALVNMAQANGFRDGGRTYAPPVGVLQRFNEGGQVMPQASDAVALRPVVIQLPNGDRLPSLRAAADDVDLLVRSLKGLAR